MQVVQGQQLVNLIGVVSVSLKVAHHGFDPAAV